MMAEDKSNVTEMPRPPLFGRPASGNSLQILITYDTETGQTVVLGPLDKQVLFYGMLKMAELACTRYNNKIVEPPAGFDPKGRRGGG